MGNKNVNRDFATPCVAKPIGADRLEPVVWEDVCEFVHNPGALLGEVERPPPWRRIE